jgi:hypothetical protein
MLERPARDKHSSVLGPFRSYEEIIYITFANRAFTIKLITAVIVAIS